MLSFFINVLFFCLLVNIIIQNVNLKMRIERIEKELNKKQDKLIK